MHQRLVGIAQQRFDLAAVLAKFGVVIVITELHASFEDSSGRRGRALSLCG